MANKILTGAVLGVAVVTGTGCSSAAKKALAKCLCEYCCEHCIEKNDGGSPGVAPSNINMNTEGDARIHEMIDALSN